MFSFNELCVQKRLHLAFLCENIVFILTHSFNFEPTRRIYIDYKNANFGENYSKKKKKVRISTFVLYKYFIHLIRKNKIHMKH